MIGIDGGGGIHDVGEHGFTIAINEISQVRTEVQSLSAQDVARPAGSLAKINPPAMQPVSLHIRSGDGCGSGFVIAGAFTRPRRIEPAGRERAQFVIECKDDAVVSGQTVIELGKPAILWLDGHVTTRGEIAQNHAAIGEGIRSDVPIQRGSGLHRGMENIARIHPTLQIHGGRRLGEKFPMVSGSIGENF